MRTCTVCKCTEAKACRGGCSWMPGCGDVCSACVRTLSPIDLLFVLFGRDAAEQAWDSITAGMPGKVTEEDRLRRELLARAGGGA